MFILRLFKFSTLSNSLFAPTRRRLQHPISQFSFQNNFQFASISINRDHWRQNSLRFLIFRSVRCDQFDANTFRILAAHQVWLADRNWRRWSPAQRQCLGQLHSCWIKGGVRKFDFKLIENLIYLIKTFSFPSLKRRITSPRCWKNIKNIFIIFNIS